MIAVVLNFQFGIDIYIVYPFRSIYLHFAAIAATFLLGVIFSKKIGKGLAIGTLVGASGTFVIFLLGFIVSLALGGGQ